MDRYKTFPPRWSHIRVPLSSRASAKAAVGLYAPCVRKGYIVQRAAWVTVSLLGPRALPGPAVAWEPPMTAATWDSLVAAWTDEVGPHDTLAVYQRPQQARGGLALLLLRRGTPLAFVRLRRSGAEVFAAEQRTLRALEAAHITAFWHPVPIGTAGADGWQSLLTTAMAAAPHRPVKRPDLGAITAAIRGALDPVLERPADLPSHWEPMHGDLTPWNVRQVRGSVAIIDWEDAAWGPPQADATLYRAAVAALRGEDQHAAAPEAAQFWLRRLAERPDDAVDHELGRRLRDALERQATQR